MKTINKGKWVYRCCECDLQKLNEDIDQDDDFIYKIFNTKKEALARLKKNGLLKKQMESTIV